MAKVPSSTTKIALVRETTEGTNPGSGFGFLRFNTADISNGFQSIESEEIRPGRKPTGAIVTDATGTINLQSQFTATDHNTLLEGGMLSTFSTTVALANQSINISGVAGTTFALTDAATASAFANVVDGQWLRLTGFNTNTGTMYAHVITKSSANVVACEGFMSTGVGTSAAVVNESGQTDIGVKASMIRIGETKHTHTIEAQLLTPSATDVYRLFTGMMMGSMGMDIAPKQLCRVNYAFQGRTSATTTSSGAGSPSAAGSNPLMNSISHVRHVMIGDWGAPTSSKLTRLTWNLNNNPEALPAISVFGADEVVAGVAAVTGAASLYVENATLLAQMEALTASKIGWVMQDTNGKAYVFSCKSIDWTADPTPIAGRTGAVILNGQWTGKVDATYDTALQIDYFA